MNNTSSYFTILQINVLFRCHDCSPNNFWLTTVRAMPPMNTNTFLKVFATFHFLIIHSTFPTNSMIVYFEQSESLNLIQYYFLTDCLVDGKLFTNCLSNFWFLKFKTCSEFLLKLKTTNKMVCNLPLVLQILQM